MADYNITRIWSDEQIYMVDFGRARARHHPSRICPDIDRYGFNDDTHVREHGPIVSTRLRRRGEPRQPRVNVRFYRTEISTRARLYAVAADGNRTIRITHPRRGLLPGRVQSTISFRPVRMGRTSIDIRYHWPDGPIIGRLYVDVRQTCTVDCRAHIVTVAGGAGQPDPYMGVARPAAMAANTHYQRRIREVFDETNKVWEPHGVFLNVREIVNSQWTNATFGANAAERRPHAMAFSPNRSRNRVNVYFVNANDVPGWAGGGYGPPIAWAINRGYRWPNTPVGRVGSGVMMDATLGNNAASDPPGMYLAHEFGHYFSLCRIVTAGAAFGVALQWHSTGDKAGPGSTHGNASRDDTISRRRLMYPTFLQPSNNAWRNDIGYGPNRGGCLIMQRNLNRDITFGESRRAYDYALIRANMYVR